MNESIQSSMLVFIVADDPGFLRKYRRYVKWSLMQRGVDLKIRIYNKPHQCFREISMLGTSNIVIIDADDREIVKGLDNEFARLKHELLFDFVVICVGTPVKDISSFFTGVEEYFVDKPGSYREISRILRNYAGMERQKRYFNLANYIVALLLLVMLVAIAAVAWMVQGMS